MSETKGGPYGDQTGAKFWQVICREHGYDPTVRHDDRTVKMRKVTKSDIEMMEKKSKQDKEDHSLNVYIVFGFSLLILFLLLCGFYLLMKKRLKV
ncbi:hypothetical protein HID58_095152 [Brassica napus]|uniref:Uncharacterized protein n=1 Tax=Brassica napus TaxID=3708 RepID=A0ABQ7X6A0_BRANA|nr:hypothetical protein HID58_095152 [Brassica napus]